MMDTTVQGASSGTAAAEPSHDPPLFRRFPRLRQNLPRLSLGCFPTPVQRVNGLESLGGARYVYIKQDGLSAARYGGNKVRKLEFLLAEALRRGSRTVITFGGAGSNHALATALYAKDLGLRPVLVLVPQPVSKAVRKNLLYDAYLGAELVHASRYSTAALRGIWEWVKYRLRDGRAPFLIPPGGSSPLGVVGFVNAAFELAEQVARGELPEPDAVYVASGTMGTCTGLLLGLQAAGLKTRVEAVRVTSGPFTNLSRGKTLFRQTAALLRRLDSSFPNLSFDQSRFTVRDEFFGKAYGLYTPEGMHAVQVARENAALHLEGTYTGKAFAALLADNARGRLDDQCVLFWNTYNARPVEDAVRSVDYHTLPKAFHRYFETPVQALDQA
jgi:D-cysteine desulfhydrase